jgi:hypothetical protein
MQASPQFLHALWPISGVNVGMQVSLLPVTASAPVPSPASSIQSQLGMLPRYYTYSGYGVYVDATRSKTVVRLTCSEACLLGTTGRRTLLVSRWKDCS